LLVWKAGVRILVCLALLCSLARADAHFNAHFGVGIGAFPERGYPSPAAEVGLLVDVLGKHGLGIGAAIGTVARPGEDLSKYEEAKLDLLLRFATPNRRWRGGIGAGLRFRTPTPVDDVEPLGQRGVDLIRVDLSARLGNLYTTPDVVFSGDAFFTFTYGCFYREEAMPDRPVARDLRCGDTMVVTYIVGLQFAISSR
jgi:hypothetical protein